MTTEIDVDAVIGEMVRRLVEQFEPTRVVLFGQHAHGDAGPDADVSLLMVLPEVEHKGRTIVKALGLLEDMPVPKEVYVATTEEMVEGGNPAGSVVREALSEGKVLFQR